MKQLPYNRVDAVEYAQKWAFLRNPKFFNFDGLGGDCTNFVSQCIYAGSGVMNFRPVFGWYYININSRSPSWSGVTYLYDFLTKNQDEGPFGIVSDTRNVDIGDIIFLKDNLGVRYHSLIITEIGHSDIYVSSHTYDSFNRPLSSYSYTSADFVHIFGVNKKG